MIVESEGDGYINYYTSEGSKVSAASNVYTLSNEKMDTQRYLEMPQLWNSLKEI